MTAVINHNKRCPSLLESPDGAGGSEKSKNIEPKLTHKTPKLSHTNLKLEARRAMSELELTTPPLQYSVLPPPCCCE